MVRGKGAHAVRLLGYRCAVIVAVAAMLLAPLVAWALDTGMLATFSALITAPVLVLLATEQGLLQGAARFGPLSVVLAAAGVAKVVPAVVVLAVGAGPGLALAASAVGTGLVALCARLFADSAITGESSTRIGVAAVLKASQVQSALIALSSMDWCRPDRAQQRRRGLYALGAVATKAAFWLPQAVGVVLYPRMANPAHSAQAIRSALAVLVGLGAVLVAAVAVAAPLVPLLVGDAPARPVAAVAVRAPRCLPGRPAGRPARPPSRGSGRTSP